MTLAFPETTLRDARVATVLLEESAAASSADHEEMLALQVGRLFLQSKCHPVYPTPIISSMGSATTLLVPSRAQTWQIPLVGEHYQFS